MGNEGAPGPQEPDQESIDRAEEALNEINEKEDEADRHFTHLLDTFAKEAFQKRYEQLRKFDAETAESYKKRVRWTQDRVKQIADDIDQWFNGRPRT